MNMILSTVLQEKQRIDYMLARYQETLSELPKGTISEKLINRNTYYYLKFRDGKKVISKFFKLHYLPLDMDYFLNEDDEFGEDFPGAKGFYIF